MFKEILTDPGGHKPGDFIYLVHSLMDWNSNGLSPQEIKDKVNRIRDPNQFYRASLIAHLDGEHAKQRIDWHGGEVYQIGTFGNVGLIVDPAYDGLVKIAWNSDVGSPHEPDKLKLYVAAHRGKIKYPLELLTKTIGPDGVKYNELILEGNERTDIKGVFYKPYDHKTELEGRLLGEVASEVIQKELPVIELPLPTFRNYDNISDPKEREKRELCDRLCEQSELMQAHLKFHKPDLFRDPFQKLYTNRTMHQNLKLKL